MRTKRSRKNRMTKALAEQERKRRLQTRVEKNGNGGNGANGHAEAADIPPRKDEGTPTRKEKGRGMKDGREKRVCVVNVVAGLVLEGGGAPYCDPMGEILIRRPEQEGTRRNRLCFPIFSRLMSAWLARLVYDNGMPPLSRSEQTQALSILEGMAIDNEEPVDCPDAIEMDPILHLLACLLSVESKWTGTATMLRSKLIEIGEDTGILPKGDARWPKTLALLSHHLRSLRDRLLEMGIVYQYDRIGWRRCHSFIRAADYPVAAAMAAKRRAEDDARTAEERRISHGLNTDKTRMGGKVSGDRCQVSEINTNEKDEGMGRDTPSNSLFEMGRDLETPAGSPFPGAPGLGGEMGRANLASDAHAPSASQRASCASGVLNGGYNSSDAGDAVFRKSLGDTACGNQRHGDVGNDKK